MGKGLGGKCEVVLHGEASFAQLNTRGLVVCAKDWWRPQQRLMSWCLRCGLRACTGSSSLGLTGGPCGGWLSTSSQTFLCRTPVWDNARRRKWRKRFLLSQYFQLNAHFRFTQRTGTEVLVCFFWGVGGKSCTPFFAQKKTYCPLCPFPINCFAFDLPWSKTGYIYIYISI